jgi:predicted DNA-binding transcriptional regulator YafY
VSAHHRLLWIDAEIRSGRHPNASTIASRFEISRRQAARDLEYLRYSLGAPLEYLATERGYRYATPGYFVPAVRLSGDEQAALAEIAHRYESADPRTVDLARLFRRLANTAPSAGDGAGDEDWSAPGPDRDRIVARLQRAIDRHQVVDLVYRDRTGRGTARRFRPRALVDDADGLRVSGHCELRDAQRALRVAGIVVLRASGQTFDDRGPHDPERPALALGPRTGEPYRAVVRFPAGVPADQPPGARPLGDDRIEIEFRTSGPLLATLLAGPAFVVERPRWLRDRLVDHLRRLLADHETAC